MRFGMNTDHTLEEVGPQFSVTRERIRQIEVKALRKQSGIMGPFGEGSGCIHDESLNERRAGQEAADAGRAL